MTKKQQGYEIVPFPRLRQFIVDSGRIAHRKHIIRCLVEVDVTKACQHIRKHKEKSGETLSFTAFVIACLGQAVETNKDVHAYRNWRNQLIIFDDVDVVTYVEVDLEDRKFPLAYIVRAINRKTMQEIQAEIRTVQASPESSPNAERWKSIKWFLYLPAMLRNIFYWLVSRSPHAWKRYVGTVYLTAVGMFGKGNGWGIGYSAHTLGVIVGGIGEKPVVREGRIEIGECLSLTVDFDHDVVDGGPAARFMEQFRQLIENGYGLIQSES